MNKKYNILLIAFLLIFGSSCSKFAPLERANDKGNNTTIKAANSDTENASNEEGQITDPEHDEDFDVDFNITDTDNDEDHDKENSKN